MTKIQTTNYSYVTSTSKGQTSGVSSPATTKWHWNQFSSLKFNVNKNDCKLFAAATAATDATNITIAATAAFTVSVATIAVSVAAATTLLHILLVLLL